MQKLKKKNSSNVGPKMPYLGIEEETLKAQLSHLKSASLDFSK